MENLLSICLGIGLSAACGFRVFIPLLVMSITSLSGHLTLSEGFQWIGTYPALVAFATASIVEIAAYGIPWLDNLMDVVAGPVAVVAGVFAAASTIVHMDPLLKWSLAIIAGGSAAAVFHASNALARGASTALTGGIGNFALAAAELGTAAILSILAIALPLVSIVVIAAFLLFAAGKGLKKLFGRSTREGGK